MGASPCHIEIVLLCTLMFHSVACSLMVHCNEKDMNTLRNFKQGVKDPSALLSSWFTTKDCCHWTGVQCDNITSRVTKLSLPCHTHSVPIVYNDKDDKSHCLSGELNLSVFDLEFLSYLDLSNNDFKTIQCNYFMHNQTCNDLSRDTLPYQCGNSSNLHFLDLSYNTDLLIDNLHWISHLSFLQYLDLSGVDLYKETNWLESVTLLPSILELHLASCRLQNISSSLKYANFTSLEVLDLRDNDFRSELPSWLFNLSSDISHIDLSQNHIHGQLPNILPNFRSLKFLYLSKNNLNGPIPDWLGQLEQLQELNLCSNSISGPISTSLGNLSSLTVLNLISNHLNGNFPESLEKLFNLELFAVNENFLTGNISERNFVNLSKLKHLGLGSPALIFDFDPEWIPHFQLQGMWLGHVGPKLPSWIYIQSSLKYLYISDSWASFEPLDKFWKFAVQLEFFALSNNSINADMSNVLLSSKIVLLNNNSLRGGVPRVLPNVTVLQLFGNSLSGSISPLLCHKMKEKRNLEVLDISNNVLSGEIPNCWMNWESLHHINLSGNNLTGKIPHSMGSLSNLILLSLDSNKLSGEVPLSLKNCKNLQILTLRENKFSGAIPSWMGQSLKALQLSSNHFSGNMQTSFSQDIGFCK